MSTRLLVFFTGMLLVRFGASPELFFQTGKVLALQQVSSPSMKGRSLNFHLPR